MRFLGNSEAKTDAKGRVFLPAIFRKQLQTAAEECLIMRKDTYQDCLVLYPESAWNEQDLSPGPGRRSQGMGMADYRGELQPPSCVAPL